MASPRDPTPSTNQRLGEESSAVASAFLFSPADDDFSHSRLIGAVRRGGGGNQGVFGPLLKPRRGGAVGSANAGWAQQPSPWPSARKRNRSGWGPHAPESQKCWRVGGWFVGPTRQPYYRCVRGGERLADMTHMSAPSPELGCAEGWVSWANRVLFGPSAGRALFLFLLFFFFSHFEFQIWLVNFYS